MSHVVYDGSTGRILYVASGEVELEPGQAVLIGSHVDPDTWRVDLATLTLVPWEPPPPPIEVVRRTAAADVDRQAELARLRFITGGSGQALEYQQTETEARAWSAAAGPMLADFPFLKAEVDAIAETTGQAPDPDAVAATVIAQADAWKAAGSEIKRLRRAAKLTIEAASTPEEIAAAQVISWPSPQ